MIVLTRTIIPIHSENFMAIYTYYVYVELRLKYNLWNYEISRALWIWWSGFSWVVFHEWILVCMDWGNSLGQSRLLTYISLVYFLYKHVILDVCFIRIALGKEIQFKKKKQKMIGIIYWPFNIFHHLIYFAFFHPMPDDNNWFW